MPQLEQFADEIRCIDVVLAQLIIAILKKCIVKHFVRYARNSVQKIVMMLSKTALKGRFYAHWS